MGVDRFQSLQTHRSQDSVMEGTFVEWREPRLEGSPQEKGLWPELRSQVTHDLLPIHNFNQPYEGQICLSCTASKWGTWHARVLTNRAVHWVCDFAGGQDGHGRPLYCECASLRVHQRQSAARARAMTVHAALVQPPANKKE